MVKKFTEHNGLNLTATNDEVLAEWNKKDIFHKSIDEREGCPQFVFFEGPPSANGHPGIHHVLARSIKDTFNRYKTMKGFQVHRKAGWDTHGLPVELGVEKELGITKADIDNKDSEKYISVRDYNNKCRENVMKFTAEWRSLTEKMGYFVDLDNPYITYDNKYIETLWWLLKQLYNKDLLYKGYTIQPYSPAAGTGLSSHELNQPGCYRDVKDTTVTAQFKIKNPRQEMTGWGEAYFLAWTTTPWTLAANSALCVGPKINYVAVRTYNPYTGEAETVVLAEERLSAYFNEAGRDADLESYSKGDKVIPWKVVGRYLGPELVGMEYEQLLPFISPLTGGAFRVISGDYVTTEDGTGIVHIAPNFGADDAFVAKKAGVPPIVVVDKKGQERPVVDLQGKYFLTEELDEKFVAEHVNVELWNEYAGRYVKNAYDETLTDKDETLDVSICMDLKASNKAFKIEKHVHNYPHCWRTDKPILYYPLDSWFIRSTAKKDRMVELNRTINWQPESTGTGRFGNWLENLNDWNLSRSRFWGTPLPIWRDEDGNEICIGSVHELYDEIEKSHPAIFTIMLQQLDAARITLSNNKTYDLSKFFIVATSNIGAQVFQNIKHLSERRLQQTLEIQLKERFSPEFVARFGKFGHEILIFRPLKPEHLRLIARNFYKQLLPHYKQSHNIDIYGFTPEVIEETLCSIDNTRNGARELRSNIERKIREFIFELLLRHPEGGIRGWLNIQTDNPTKFQLHTEPETPEVILCQ